MKNIFLLLLMLFISADASATTTSTVYVLRPNEHAFCVSGAPTNFVGTYFATDVVTITYTDSSQTVTEYVDTVGTDGKTYRVTFTYASTTLSLSCPIQQ